MFKSYNKKWLLVQILFSSKYSTMCWDNCYCLTASKNNPILDVSVYDKSHGFPSSMVIIKKTPATPISGKKNERGREKTLLKCTKYVCTHTQNLATVWSFRNLIHSFGELYMTKAYGPLLQQDLPASSMKLTLNQTGGGGGCLLTVLHSRWGLTVRLSTSAKK